MEKNTNTVKHQRKVMRQSTLIIFLGLIIMTGLTVYVVKNSPSLQSTLKAERPIERETQVYLAAFEKKSNNEFLPVLAKVKPGSKLAFELSSNVPVHVTLFAGRGSRMPEILFEKARIPPGKGKRLGKSGTRFIFDIPAEQGPMRICLIQAKNDEALQRKHYEIRRAWARLPKNQCVDLIISV